jgi:hypothetical protein
LDTYVRVTGADWERLGVEAERVAHFIGHRAYMRMKAGEAGGAGCCAALEVRADAAGGREFFCTVYAARPQVCRDLARGSPECEGELALKGARVPAGGDGAVHVGTPHGAEGRRREAACGWRPT